MSERAAGSARRRGQLRRVGTLALVVTAAVAGGVVWRNARLAAELVRTDPDTIGAQPSLARYARALALPAYARHCAGCHGADLEGNAVRGAPNLKDADWLYGSGLVWEIERTIAHGIRSNDSHGWNLAEMPAFARAKPSSTYEVAPLRPAQLDDVVEYVVALSGGGADHAAADRGAWVFAHEGACVDCHSTDGKGDSAIGAPDLTDTTWLYGDGSRAAIRRSIAYGRHGVCPAWGTRLTPATLRALAYYIHVRAAGGTS